MQRSSHHHDYHPNKRADAGDHDYDHENGDDDHGGRWRHVSANNRSSSPWALPATADHVDTAPPQLQINDLYGGGGDDQDDAPPRRPNKEQDEEENGDGDEDCPDAKPIQEEDQQEKEKENNNKNNKDKENENEKETHRRAPVRRIGIITSVVLCLVLALALLLASTTVICALTTSWTWSWSSTWSWSWSSSSSSSSSSPSATNLAPADLEVLSLSFHWPSTDTETDTITNRHRSGSSNNNKNNNQARRQPPNPLQLIPPLNLSEAAHTLDTLATQIDALYGNNNQDPRFRSTLMYTFNYALPTPKSLARASTALRALAGLETGVRAWVRAVGQRRTLAGRAVERVGRWGEEEDNRGEDKNNKHHRLGGAVDEARQAVVVVHHTAHASTSTCHCRSWWSRWWRAPVSMPVPVPVLLPAACACALVPLPRLHAVMARVDARASEALAAEVQPAVNKAMEEVTTAVKRSCGLFWLGQGAGGVGKSEKSTTVKYNNKYGQQQQQQEALEAFYRATFQHDQAELAMFLGDGHGGGEEGRATSDGDGAGVGGDFHLATARPMSRTLSALRDTFAQAQTTCRDLVRSLSVVEWTGCSSGGGSGGEGGRGRGRGRGRRGGRDDDDDHDESDESECGDDQASEYEFPKRSLLPVARREVERLHDATRRVEQRVMRAKAVVGWWSAWWAENVVAAWVAW